MSRVAPSIGLDTDRTFALQRLLRAPTTSQALALRIMIVLKASQGESNQGIAAHLGIACATVGKWRYAFVAHGLAGLNDQPRQGRPRKYGPEMLDQIRTKLQRRRRRPRFGLSVRALAREVNVPRSSLHHLLTVDRHRVVSPAEPEPPREPRRTLRLRGVYITRVERALVLGLGDDRARPARLHPPSVFVGAPSPAPGGRSRSILDAIDHVAATSSAWTPPRSDATGLVDFVTAMAGQDSREDVHVIRNGNRAMSPSLPDGAIQVHECAADVWYGVAQIVLSVLPIREVPAAPALGLSVVG